MAIGLLKVLYLFGFITMVFPVSDYWLTSTVILITAFSIILFEMMLNKKIPNRLFNSYSLLIGVWFIWSLLTYFWVADFDLWGLNNNYLAIGLGYTIFTSYIIKGKGFMKSFYTIIILSATAHILISFFEIISGIYLFTSNDAITASYALSKYPVSFFYNTNDLATFLMFAFCIILYVDPKIYTDSINRRVFSYLKPILLISILIIVFFTDSRLVLVSIIIALLLWFYLNVNKKYFWVLNIPLITIAIGIIISSFTVYSDKILSILVSDGSGSSRVTLMRSAWDMLKESNFIGVGAGNLEYHMENNPSYGSGTIYAAHNWWMEILANYGLIFFIIYIIYYLRKLWQSFIIAFKTKSNDMKLVFTWFIIFIPGSLASSSLFDDIWLWTANAIMFVFLIRRKKSVNL